VSNGLGIGLYATAQGGPLLADLAARGAGHRFSTGPHGFQTYTCVVPLGLLESFYLYDRPGLPHVAVTWQGGVVWEGRVEDVSIVDGGVKLTAFGYWRALYDVPYTALWSATRVDEWRPITVDDVAARTPERYSIDTNNRLFIGLTINSSYAANVNVGGLTFRGPYFGERPIVAVSFDYEMLLPSTWTLELVRADDDFTNRVAITTVAATGVLQTGTVDQTFTGQYRLEINIYRSTVGTTTYTGETGANYVKITNLHVQTQDDYADVGGDQIVWALIAYVNALNATQLSSSIARVAVPNVALKDETYEDEWPADIIDRLAALGDNTAQVYEAGVWEGRVLVFQPRGETARQWFVDASSLEVERTLDTLRNSVYAVYRESDWRELRTTTSTDTASVARYGLTRRRAVEASTTSSTQAGKQRAAALQDGKDPAPRASLVFRELYDTAGVRWPLWAVRAWDTVTIRNLPPTLSVDIDRIRTFRLAATEYDVDADLLTVTPEGPLPRLENAVLRQSVGR
jgi:hypothetical protein